MGYRRAGGKGSCLELDSFTTSYFSVAISQLFNTILDPFPTP